MSAIKTAVALSAALLLGACSVTKPATNADIARAGTYSAPAGASTPTLSPDGAMIGPNGRTLYTYSGDTASVSNCNGTCAVNWPPLPVAANAVPMGDYTIIDRADGSRQWAYKGMPLYYFTRDANAGERTGDGMGGMWRMARP